MRDRAPSSIRVATAGWGIPQAKRPAFADGPSILHRYAQTFDAVEINSSFYRPHRRSTYERWAESTPPGFRFAVKMPRAITHAAFVDVMPALDRFLGEIAGLGDRLGLILIQTPASQAFAAGIVPRFLTGLRVRFSGALACEPRHPSWFTREVDRLLVEQRVARVAADPTPIPDAAISGGWPSLVYHRLHGSPEIYASSYDDGRLAPLAGRLQADARRAETWCVFDNTKHGHATSNALAIRRMVADGRPGRS